MFRKSPTILYYLTRSYSMSSNTENTPDIQLLATYGTLRDDDDSGAPWTANFLKVSYLTYLFEHYSSYSLKYFQGYERCC